MPSSNGEFSKMTAKKDAEFISYREAIEKLSAASGDSVLAVAKSLLSLNLHKKGAVWKCDTGILVSDDEGRFIFELLKHTIANRQVQMLDCIYGYEDEMLSPENVGWMRSMFINDLRKLGLTIELETLNNFPSMMELPKKNVTPPVMWPMEYSLIFTFNKYEAALIMAGIIPDEVDFLGDDFENTRDRYFWETQPLSVTRKLTVINACALDLIARTSLASTKNIIDLGVDEKIPQEVWREWCEEKGFDWPIPKNQNKSHALPLPDMELQERFQQSQAELKQAQIDICILKGQLADAQNVVVELKRISNDRSTTPLHFTYLMKYAIEVQKEHWPQLNSNPKQVTLVSTIREKYNLSEILARAVEYVACPNKR
jgi:hypothetical protein